MHNSLLHLLLKNCDFLNKDISQGSVATRLWCGGVFKYGFVTNFLLSLKVKEFWKSVNIWWSYGQEFGVLFFLTHSVDPLLIPSVALWIATTVILSCLATSKRHYNLWTNAQINIPLIHIKIQTKTSLQQLSQGWRALTQHRLTFIILVKSNTWYITPNYWHLQSNILLNENKLHFMQTCNDAYICHEVVHKVSSVNFLSLTHRDASTFCQVTRNTITHQTMKKCSPVHSISYKIHKGAH